MEISLLSNFPPGIEFAPLALDHAGDFGIALFTEQVGREFNLLASVALGQKPGFHGPQFIPLEKETAVRRLGRGPVHPDQDLPGCDRIAFADENFLDDTPFQMLDRLVLTGRRHNARCHGGAVQRRRGRPNAAAAKTEQHCERADKHRTAGTRSQALVPGVERGSDAAHGAGLPPGTILMTAWRRCPSLALGQTCGACASPAGPGSDPFTWAAPRIWAARRSADRTR